MGHQSSTRRFYEAGSLSTEIYDARSATIIPSTSAAGDVDFYRRLAGQTGSPPADGREQVWVLRRADE